VAIVETGKDNDLHEGQEQFGAGRKTGLDDLGDVGSFRLESGGALDLALSGVVAERAHECVGGLGASAGGTD